MKKIITLKEYYTNLNIIKNIKELELRNKTFINDFKMYDFISKEINRSDIDVFYRSIINLVCLNIEVNFSYLNKLTLEFGNNNLTSEEKETILNDRCLSIVFSHLYIWKQPFDRFLYSSTLKALNNVVNNFNRVFNSDIHIEITDISNLVNCLYQIRNMYPKISKDLYDNFIGVSKVFTQNFNIFIDNCKVKVKKFEDILKQKSFELRLDKETFNDFVETKNEYSDELEGSGECYLYFSIGDDIDIELLDLKYLPSTIRNIYLVWLLEQEVLNGGFNQYFFNVRGKYLEETLEALKIMGLDKQAIAMKKALNIYYSKLKPIHDDLESCEEFWDTYEIENLNDIDNEFCEVENLGEISDLYIEKNIKNIVYD